MSSRLMKTALAAVLTCVAASATATESRIQSLGGGVKEFTVLDDRNIFALPAELVKYGTWTAIEIGAPGFTSFAFHYNFSPSVVLAVYGSNETRDAVTVKAGGVNVNQSSAAANTGLAGQTHKATILMGFDLGQTRLGAKLGIWGSKDSTSNKDNDPESDNGPLIINFGFGAGFAIGSSDLDLGLDILYGSPTHIEAAGEDASTNSQFGIGLLGRLNIPFAGPHEIVPFLKLDMAFANGELKAEGSSKFSGTDFDLQAGIDIRLNLGDGIIVQPGVGLGNDHTGVSEDNPNAANDSNPVDTSYNDFFLFYNVAVDVKVLDWLDLRFGGSQRINFEKVSTTVGGDFDHSNTKHFVDHKISTGVGFNLPAGFSIDIEVNKDWWKNGPNFITGNQNAFGANAALSKDW